VRIGMMGTRGVPARYGGFETAIEEIGRRLVGRGHDVVVYCRPDGHEADPAVFLGMRRVELPAVKAKAAETLSHTAVSALHSLRTRRCDAMFLFNAANAPFLPLLRRRGVPVAVHVDGLEWRRAKWGGAGRRFYLASEAIAVRWADALIADAQGIADYYTDEFGASTELIAYGAPILADVADDRLAALDVEAGRFHLVVARFEPENHVHLIVDGFRRSSAAWPLVVVGSAPYADDYTAELHAAAAGDLRIRFVGGVWDQDQLDQLYHHAATYLHGHSVGGTNPSLLRAMGAGASVGAFDVSFNRGVLGDTGRFFADAAGVAALVEAAEADRALARALGAAARERAAAHYRWDDVAVAYERLAERLASGASRRREVSGRRRGHPAWQ
jgi:glycosyltransferase involved in cell wall biosynthesis